MLSHYYLGPLVLADILDTLDIVPEPLNDPRLSRSYACTAIVNAVSLALNYDRYSDDTCGSILLRDPTPIIMVETLSRLGTSIFLLYESGKVDTTAAQMMVSVAVAALTVLSQVSVTATFALTSLRQGCAKHKLSAKNRDPSIPAPSNPEDLKLLAMCDGDFIDEFLQEMKLIEASDNSSMLEKTIAKYEHSQVDHQISPSVFPTSVFL